MNIAVLADIHGNAVAFRRCMEYALERNIETFVFLGDYVAELADPQKTMQFLYEIAERYQCFFVKGNKEDYWINAQSSGAAGWKDKDSTTGALLYNYRHLKERDIEFFKKLNIREELAFDGEKPFTICHGSPNKVNEKLKPNDEATLRIMEKSSTDLILCGHTHLQGKIEHQGKIVLNPGSVGLPLASDGKAQFLILHSGQQGWEEEFIHLDYDVEQAILELNEDGLKEVAPCWGKVTEYILRTGKSSHATVLAKAMEYCREETGVCNWPEIPEKYWERAVEDLLA